MCSQKLAFIPLESPARLQRGFLTGFTLLEALIAIALVSVISIISLGLGSIIVFSRFQTASSSRRQQAQNEVFVALEHMNKWVFRTIGNEVISGANSVVNDNVIAGDAAIRVYIAGSIIMGSNDYWIAYRLRGAPLYRIEFCPKCADSSCGNCDVLYPPWGSTESIIARNINAFEPSKPGVPGSLSENNITVSITGCFDASIPESVDNPCITMTERIIMPSVSTN